MPTERLPYTDLGSRVTRAGEAFAEDDDLPTNNGAGFVYFAAPAILGNEYPIEANISPGAKFVQDGDVKRMVEGHILLLCPKCAKSSGRMSPLHVDARNRTIFIREAAKHYVPKSDPRKNFWLSILTILEPIACDYREPSVGSCDWRAKIAEGVAYEVGGMGQTFLVTK